MDQIQERQLIYEYIRTCAKSIGFSTSSCHLTGLAPNGSFSYFGPSYSSFKFIRWRWYTERNVITIGDSGEIDLHDPSSLELIQQYFQQYFTQSS